MEPVDDRHEAFVADQLVLRKVKRKVIVFVKLVRPAPTAGDARSIEAIRSVGGVHGSTSLQLLGLLLRFLPQ